jgi:hypothetical protein
MAARLAARRAIALAAASGSSARPLSGGGMSARMRSSVSMIAPCGASLEDGLRGTSGCYMGATRERRSQSTSARRGRRQGDRYNERDMQRRTLATLVRIGVLSDTKASAPSAIG